MKSTTPESPALSNGNKRNNTIEVCPHEMDATNFGLRTTTLSANTPKRPSSIKTEGVSSSPKAKVTSEEQTPSTEPVEKVIIKVEDNSELETDMKFEDNIRNEDVKIEDDIKHEENSKNESNYNFQYNVKLPDNSTLDEAKALSYRGTVTLSDRSSMFKGLRGLGPGPRKI